MKKEIKDQLDFLVDSMKIPVLNISELENYSMHNFCVNLHNSNWNDQLQTDGIIEITLINVLYKLLYDKDIRIVPFGIQSKWSSITQNCRICFVKDSNNLQVIDNHIYSELCINARKSYEKFDCRSSTINEAKFSVDENMMKKFIKSYYEIRSYIRKRLISRLNDKSIIQNGRSIVIESYIKELLDANKGFSKNSVNYYRYRSGFISSGFISFMLLCKLRGLSVVVQRTEIDEFYVKLRIRQLGGYYTNDIKIKSGYDPSIIKCEVFKIAKNLMNEYVTNSVKEYIESGENFFK